MNFHVTFQPVAALVAGCAIFAKPELLNYIVALYLLFIGVVGLFA